MSQSTWSIRLYQVKPSTGTPSLRMRRMLTHCFHSQSAPASGSKYVGLGVHHRLLVALVIVAGDLVPAEHVLRPGQAAVGQDYLFVAAVIVVAHDLVAGRLAAP